MKNIISIIILFCGSFLVIGCSDNDEQVIEKSKKDIVIGTTVGIFGDQVKESIKPVLEAKGYDVKLIEFTDYIRPNLALAEGSIDLNVFQHKPYLDSFKKEHNLAITDLFEVPTAPYGIYGGRAKSLDQVKKGSSISAPNDPSNFSRVLVILDYLGWIKLRDGFDPLLASKRDIEENILDITIIELEAAQLPRSLSDVDYSAINGNYAVSSGMKLTDAIFQEPSFTYINVGVIRESDLGEEWVKDVSEAYNSDEFKTYTKENLGGYQLPSTWNQ